LAKYHPRVPPTAGREATFRKRLFWLRVLATLIVPNIRTYLIWGEVQYAHNPTFGYVLTATFTLKSEMDMARGCRAW